VGRQEVDIGFRWFKGFAAKIKVEDGIGTDADG